MSRKKLPGAFAHVVAFVLALLLTLIITVTVFAWQGLALLQDEGLHEKVALNDRILDMQLERIELYVEELAETWSFQPETVMQFVTRETLSDYGREVIAWWTGLTGEDAEIAAPVWNDGEIAQAVREDELFMSVYPAERRRAIARDDIAYEIGQEIRKTVLPLRTDLVEAVLPGVLAQMDMSLVMDYVSQGSRLIGVVAAGLVLLIVLVMIRWVFKALLYIGSSLIASGLGVAAINGTALLLNIPGMVGEISPILAGQMELLMGQMLLRVGIVVLIALVMGGALLWMHRAALRRLCRGKRAQA